MSLWTNATLGVAAVVACAGGVVAQTPGCAACNGKTVAGAVPNTIPHCSKHDGLTQYPLSEKRYIKQFCGPTICPNSCFGHFKTQWTAWPQACPGWPVEGVDPANFGPNFTRYAPPPAEVAKPAAKADDAAPKVEIPAPASKPLELPPSKPAAPKSPLEVPPVPMPPTPAPGGVKLPELPGGRF